MDSFRSAHYTSRLDIYLYRAFGAAFQTLFWDIMGRRYGDQFLMPKPWGAVGDFSCDGFLVPEKRCFACYGPERMSPHECTEKITNDFRGAMEHWCDQYAFENWTFVHNARQGLPPQAVQALYALDQEHEDVAVGHWGPSKLERIVAELSDDDAAAIFGAPPALADFASLGYGDLEAVLDHVGEASPVPPRWIRPVPASKITANGLSDAVVTLLRAGERWAPRVHEFISSYYDAMYGERICTRFGQEYAVLKEQHLSPDEIYHRLMVFAGGDLLAPAKRCCAVYAVLTYLFDACEIFEAPRGTERP
ncbi:hypothetical protein LLH03_14790 [bacterium]|nr:hypothetical protein [bacterium]